MYTLLLALLTSIASGSFDSKNSRLGSAAYLTTILSFGGVPLLGGFFGKLPIVVMLLASNNLSLVTLFLVTNFIFLYFYMQYLSVLVSSKKRTLLQKS